MLKRKVLLMVCIYLSVLQGYAQTTVFAPEKQDDVSLQGNFANNYNVDLFTGIANTTVPIYDYSIDGINLSVTLNYGCKGIKVDQISGSCGLGWELNSGGYITREVQGIEDEIKIPQDDTMNKFYHGSWNVSQGAINVLPDGEIGDIYTVVIGNRSFKMSGGNLAAFSPSSEVNVQVLKDGVPFTSSTYVDGMNTNEKISFIITDEQGNKFEFERGDYQVKEIKKDTIPYNTLVVYYVATKWVLTKVTTYSGAVVTYTYSYINNISFPQYIQESIKEDNQNGAWTVSEVYQKREAWSGTLSHIAQINYPNGVTIKFNQGTARCDLLNSYILSSIDVESKYDNTVKNTVSYKLNYAYFNTPIPYTASLPSFSYPEVPYDPNGASCDQFKNSLQNAGYTLDQAWDRLKLGLRLKLKGITKALNNSTPENYYTFGYEWENDNNHALPLRLSPYKDWYGYSNNKTITPLSWQGDYYSLAVPGHSLASGGYGADKTPDVNYLKAWTLNKITNAIGGVLQLQYGEPTGLINSIALNSHMDAQNTYDGLRLEKLIAYDGYNHDNDFSIEYSYANGQRFYPGGFFWMPFTYFPDPSNQYALPSTAYGNIARRIYSNSFVNYLKTSRNSNHGYSDVTVIKKGFNNEIVGNTHYHFQNIDGSAGAGISYSTDDQKTETYITGNATASGNYFHDELLGAPLQVTTQSPDGLPLKSKTFTYGLDDPNAWGIGHSQKFNIFWSTNNPNNPDEYYAQPGSYVNSLYRYCSSRLLTATETTHIGNSTLVNSTNYYYDNNNNVTETHSYNGLEEMYKQYYIYNYQYTTPNTVLPGRQFLLTTKTLRTISNADGELVCNTSRPIEVNGNVLFSSSFSLASDQVLGSGQYADDAAAINTNASADNFLKVKEVTLYDDKNNALEVRHNDMERYSSCIWDTRIAEKLAEVDNAKYNQIACTSFEGVFLPETSTDYNRGNWSFNPANVTLGTSTVKSLTGRYYYSLSPSNDITSNITLVPGEKYLLTFWANTSPTIYLHNHTLGDIQITATSKYTAGSWVLYAAEIQVNETRTVRIASASGTKKIDELRLHPLKATVNTYTYEPLLGVSSHCDEQNDITYFEYDSQGRPYIIRDINGNIISLTNTKVRSAD